MTIPRPPASVLDLQHFGRFEPAQDLRDWVLETVLLEDGALFNPDHAHLVDAKIGFLWTTASCRSKGRTVLGMAEIPAFRCNQWQRARQEQQIIDWFGGIPDFLVTLDAYYANGCSEVEFLALLEHELYHCGQALDEFGVPRFNRDTGEPVFTLKGHDVEEFVGVVRRYGVVSEDVADLVIAASQKPEVSRVDIARACGTCALKSA